MRSRIANDKEETVIDPLFSCARFLSRSIFRVNEFPFEARIERIRSYSNSSLTVQAREISATDYEDAVKQKQIAREEEKENCVRARSNLSDRVSV